jgi:UDP-N-acetylglucosamine 2-epimerase (non-hydrolysing)
MKTLRVASVVGTRPEAIKMVPVLRELRKHPQIEAKLISTAQHREMLDQVFGLFEIEPDIDLHVMKPNQSLNLIVERAVHGLDEALGTLSPDVLLVQGDTTTAFVAALAGFHRKIEVGHVEAGLRSNNRYNPYPEEMNRRLISGVAGLHFAPTEESYLNLIREGIAEENIYLTGNTVVDCLMGVASTAKGYLAKHLPSTFHLNGNRMILITAHRRENHNGPIGELCEAVAEMAREMPDLSFLYPVHMNPKVRETVFPLLSGLPNVALIEPLPYCAFVEAMATSHLILTDSGGVQEEAPSLGKPVLVLRETTERPEGVSAGSARIIGTNRERIVAETLRLLSNRSEYEQMAACRSPYGDGHAAERTVQGILHHFGMAARPDAFLPQTTRSLETVDQTNLAWTV